MALIMGEGQVSVARLTVPAEPSCLRLARLTVSSLAADLDWPVDEIDDIRIAIDELTAALIAGDPPGPVELSFSRDGDGLVVEGSCRGPGTTAGLDPLALELLSLTTDHFSLDRVAGRRHFRVEKRPGNAPTAADLHDG